MSELIVQPGSWNSFNSSEVESFLAAVSIFLGLTQKRIDFLKQVHQDIHGRYTPDKDKYYQDNLRLVGTLPPHTVLQEMIMKNCNAGQKKQLKIWFTELLAMEPMHEINPLFEMLILPGLSNTINTF